MSEQNLNRAIRELNKSKQGELRAVLLRLYQNELIADVDSADWDVANPNIHVYLHSHSIPYPIPLTHYTTAFQFSESSGLEGMSGYIRFRLPFDLFALLFQGEGAEPSAGHWLTIRKRVTNIYKKRGDTFKRNKPPEGETVAQVAESLRNRDVGTTDTVAIAQDVANQFERLAAAKQFEEELRQHKENEIDRKKSFDRKMSKIFFENMFIGQIDGISFQFTPVQDQNGITMMSEITCTLKGFDNPLRTSSYKIVNAQIDRKQKASPDDEEADVVEQDGVASTGGRFIINQPLFRKIIKQVADGITTSQDLKKPMEDLLSIFGYQKVPSSVTLSNTSIRKLIKSLSEYEYVEVDTSTELTGKPEEITSKLEKIRDQLFSAGENEIVDTTGRTWSLEEVARLTDDQIEKLFVGGESSITVYGSRSPYLGDEILVATKQSDLPESSGLLRSLLPETPLYTKDVGRFREIMNHNGSPWSRIVGSFVPDENLIELFPIVVPFDLDDIKKGFKPRGRIASVTKNQMVLIWRIKPVRPIDLINKRFYNTIVENYNKSKAVVSMWNEHEPTTIDFATTKLNDQESYTLAPSLQRDTSYVESLDVSYSENNKINAAYLEHAFLRSESNLKFGTLSQPMIDTESAQRYGFRMYEANYPFLTANVTKLERDALTEKAYVILRDEGEGAIGSIVFRGMHRNPMMAGTWLTLSLSTEHNIGEAFPGSQALPEFDNYLKDSTASRPVQHSNYMLSCLIKRITTSYETMLDGHTVRQTVVEFIRGKFVSGYPTRLPVRHDFGRPNAGDEAGLIKEGDK